MTAPLRNTAANPSASGATAATSVPKPASRISRISGKPSVSPRASCFFETSWKFDQIAGSPITRVCAAAVVCTSARRRCVASSIAFELFPRYASGRNTALPRLNGPARAHARLRRDEAPHRRRARAGAAAGDEHRERRRNRVRPVLLEGVRDLHGRAAGHLPAAAGEVVALVEREPAARCEQHDPDRERRCAADARRAPASRPRERSTITPSVAAASA